MKTFSKALSLVLVVVLALALAAPAFADTNGVITIQNATAGKDYAAYKIFDAEVGTSGKATFSIDSSSLWFETVNSSGLFELTETATAGTYTVVASSGVSDSAIIDLFKAKFTYADGATTCSITGVQPVDSESAAADGTVTLSVPAGYYYITSSLGAVVTVNTAKPNVTVIDKNQKPDWDNEDPNTPVGSDGNAKNGKVIVLEDGTKVTENSANYGDVVKFDIGISATNFDGTDLITYYYITDTLGDGFELNANSIEVKVGSEAISATALNTLTGETYHLVQHDNTFTVVINWCDINATSGKLASIYENAVEIHVQYTATVTDAAVLGTAGNLNTANFTYDSIKDDPSTDDVDEGYDPENPPDTKPDPTDPDDPTNPPEYDDDNEKETKTKVYAIGLQKTDADNAPLAGAHFEAKDIKLVGSNGIYSYDANGTASLDLVCSSSGMLIIKGLAEGTYTLNETIAPDDYNLNASDLTFTVSSSATDTVFGGVTVAVKTDFINRTGSELPSTGGIGTTLFITFGALVTVVTGVFLVTNKRISKEDF